MLLSWPVRTFLLILNLNILLNIWKEAILMISSSPQVSATSVQKSFPSSVNFKISHNGMSHDEHIHVQLCQRLGTPMTKGHECYKREGWS